MAVSSIGSVINAGFIRSFQGLAGSDGPAIGAGAGEGASVYSGLRLGARTFAASIQNLNTAISFVNISENTIKKLDKIVDKMIVVAEKGTSLSYGSESRRKIQAELEDLVNDFRDITENSEFNDIDYLTEEGLSTLLARVGLDKEDSDGLARVLKQFLVKEDEGKLVSEETKGDRPAYIPSLRKSRVTQVTDSSIPVSGGAVSTDYNIFQENDYSGFYQPYSVDTLGNINSPAAATADRNLLSVNPRNGYSLVSSTEDLVLGDNPGGYEQLFLIAPDGSVARQITNHSAATSINSADISWDNLSAAVSIYDGVDYYVNVISVAAINDPPTLSSLVDSILTSGSNVKISGDGSYLAYDVSGTINLKQVGNPAITTFGSQPAYFDFASNNSLIHTDERIAGYFSTIYSYDTLSAQSSVLVSESGLSHLAILENDPSLSINDGSPSGSPQISAIAYNTVTSSTNRLTVASFDPALDYLKTRYRRDLGAGTVNSLSLSYQADSNTSKDRIDVGVTGTLPSLFADSDTEMYRVSESKFALNASLFASVSADPTNILDGNVLTRADSYRLLSDLKALKEQMTTNLKTLDTTKTYILDNIELVRAAGFAFLNISNQISGTEDAEQVAKLVASEIRRNTSLARQSHSENLTNIVSQTTALLDEE